VIEVFLRYYDLLTFVEASEGRDAKRVLGCAKQKLVLWLAYVKSELWQPLDAEILDFITHF
jgi:hypothetical protein